MKITSVPRRSEIGEKDWHSLQSNSPILREPQKAVTQITQKHCLSCKFPVQYLLDAWPNNLRNGMLTGLCVAPATAITGFLDEFS